MRLIDATIQPKFLVEYILERKSTFIRVLEKGDNDFLFGLIMDYFDEQPTAYDVDKVVEQLEDYGNEETCYYKNTPYERCIEECIGKALEIVKVGGNINE